MFLWMMISLFAQVSRSFKFAWLFMPHQLLSGELLPRHHYSMSLNSSSQGTERSLIVHECQESLGRSMVRSTDIVVRSFKATAWKKTQPNVKLTGLM